MSVSQFTSPAASESSRFEPGIPGLSLKCRCVLSATAQSQLCCEKSHLTSYKGLPPPSYTKIDVDKPQIGLIRADAVRYASIQLRTT